MRRENSACMVDTHARAWAHRPPVQLFLDQKYHQARHYLSHPSTAVFVYSRGPGVHGDGRQRQADLLVSADGRRHGVHEANHAVTAVMIAFRRMNGLATQHHGDFLTKYGVLGTV